MSEDVIVIMAHGNYIAHAKALMVNCVRQGNWKGDFCLLVGPGEDPGDIESHGISVMQAPDSKGNQLKFWIFSEYFRKWKRVLYIDCDSLIQGDLNKAFDEMATKLPAILCDGGVDPSNRSILDNWKYFDDNFGEGPGPDAHPELYERMEARFPHVKEIVFTMNACFFAPETIPPGTLDELKAVAEEFKEANSANADQPTMNVVLYDRMAPLTKDICCWFAFDEPSHRVPSPGRGWRGDEEPVIIHYWSWHAPWLAIHEGGGGYFNHRLDRVCHELYMENLALFNTTFPKKDTVNE